MKSVAKNRRAHFKYHILETFDAGLALTGPEVKSIRAREISIEDGFCRVIGNELYLWNVHITSYRQGSTHVEQEPTRSRKILLHRSEIKKIMGQLSTKGVALIPLEIYFPKSGYAKVKLGIAKGKKGPDKREDIKRRDLERELRRDYSGRHSL